MHFLTNAYEQLNSINMMSNYTVPQWFDHYLFIILWLNIDYFLQGVSATEG